MNEEEKNNGPIKIIDRRRFNTDGSMKDSLPEEPKLEVKPSATQTPEKTIPPSSSRAPGPQGAGPEPRPAPASGGPSPKGDYDVNFAQFIFSLASSVQMALGLAPNPVTNTVRINLASAKQSIDIIAMLEDKTRGNLDEEEAHLIKQILYELRMVYVEVTNKLNKQPPQP